MHRSLYAHSFARVASAAAAALLLGAVPAGCGGGGTEPTEAEVEAMREESEEQAQPVTVADFGPNVVSVWNEIAFNTFALPATPAGATPEERVSLTADLATVQLAVYDAVIAIAGTHKPYAIRPTTQGLGGGPVAMQAAAIEAAYRTLKSLFPSRGAVYETAYADGMAGLPDNGERARGRLIGVEVAAGMLALRANDGRETVLAPYVPGTLPGQFRGTNPVNRIGAYTRPFVTTSHAQFRAPGPTALDSAGYATDLNEVKEIASASSTTRTPEQTTLARFHTEPPNAYYARNLRRFATGQTDLAQNARILAMLWTVNSDAINGCFESKYHYNFWRPTSGIRLADTDGNAATTPDVAWTPVVPTPNHPEYPGAHGCSAGSAAEVLRSFYGTKKVVFQFDSLVTGTTLTLERTDELVKSNVDGRVFGGMHLRTSAEHGSELGKQVAKWLVKHHFQAVP